MSKVLVKDVKRFIAPLNALLNNKINSISFNRTDGSIAENTFEVNARSEDNSQNINIVFKSDIVSVDSNGPEKLGIYDLGSFLTVINMFDSETTKEIEIVDNRMNIQIGEKSNVEYILSDSSLIKEGFAEPKTKIPFVISFEVNSNFIKRVRNAARSLGANILKFELKKGVLSYSVMSRLSNSHRFNEILSEDCGNHPDLSVTMTIKDDARDNVGILPDGFSYKISLHEKIVCFEALTDEYSRLRYFLSPIAIQK